MDKHKEEFAFDNLNTYLYFLTYPQASRNVISSCLNTGPSNLASREPRLWVPDNGDHNCSLNKKQHKRG